MTDDRCRMMRKILTQFHRSKYLATNGLGKAEEFSCKASAPRRFSRHLARWGPCVRLDNTSTVLLVPVSAVIGPGGKQPIEIRTSKLLLLNGCTTRNFYCLLPALGSRKRQYEVLVSLITIDY